jgi:peptidoglycan/LPS O-acetylase OafA/YrhL
MTARMNDAPNGISCPSCGQITAEGAVTCPVCRTPLQARLIREIWIFLVFLGAACLFMAWVIRANPSGHSDAPTLVGLVLTGAFFSLCGILFALTRRTIIAYIGAAGAILAILAIGSAYLLNSAKDDADSILKIITVPAVVVVVIGYRVSKLRFAKRN